MAPAPRPRSHLVGVAASVQNVMQRHAAVFSGVLTHSERRAVSAFIQAPEDYFDAEPTFKQSYAPQSGEIFGRTYPPRRESEGSSIFKKYRLYLLRYWIYYNNTLYMF